MIVLAGIVLGAFWGAGLARRRKGKGLDIAQYAGAFAIIGAVIGLFVTVFLDRVL